MTVYVDPGCCGCKAQKVYPDNDFNKLDNMNQKLVRSADNDDPESCYNLGKNLIEGQYGFPVMLNLGENYLLKAVKKDHVEALIYYAQVLQDGDKIPRNEKKAKKYLERAAKKGSSIARVRLGQFYLDSNEPKKAVKELKKGVKQNNSEAMICLSQLYQDGVGVKQNNEEALKLLKRASNTGYPPAVNAYAAALKSGLICNKDLNLAAQLYKTNADIGNRNASYEYARMLENGEGIAQNVEDAATYFKIAADLGHAESAYHYAHMLINGKGIEKNEKSGLEYLKKAADMEHPEALYEWAVKLFYGRGIQKNESQAEEYCKKSAIKGCVNAEYFYAVILLNQEQYEQSSSFLMTASNKGHKEASMQLAFMRLYGCGCKVQFKEAYDIFKKFEADPQARIGLGIMCENGFYVEKNYQLALEYYRSLQGTPREPDGIAREAYMVLVGHGFPNPDEMKAIEMFERTITSTQILDPDSDLGNESTLGTAYYYYLTIRTKTEEAINILTDLSYRRKDMYAREKLALIYLKGIQVQPNVEKAISLFKSSAAQGNRDSLYHLGLMYLSGKNVGEVNNQQAAQYLKKSAKLGNMDAHAKYSDILLKGIGVPCKNERKALKHARISAESGNLLGMAYYGSMLYYGNGCQADYEEAKPFIVRASDAQIPEAIDVLGLMYYNGHGFETDLPKAASLFERGAELGYAESIFHYAQVLESGQGVTQNLPKAAGNYMRAADKGHVQSMYVFATFSEKGIGTCVNLEDAAKYYLQAANKDHVDSMACYAALCHDGRGVKQDYKEALKWNKQAADLGSTKAMNNYAEQLIKGEGCFKKKKDAISYLEKSASKGDAHGIFLLGQCYENGDGVDQDMHKAAEKYKEAAEKEDDDAMQKTADIMAEGKYLPKNTEKAYEYYLILAERGNAHCCVKMGQHLEEQGQFSDAAAFYKTAAEKEDPVAMFSYGKMCLDGNGIDKDIANGVKFIEKAANANLPAALTRYATILMTGAFEVKKNEKKAFKMLKQAEGLGDKDALHHLATSYEFGKGTKTDLKKAAEFYEKSFKSGSQYAKDDEENCNRVQEAISSNK